MDYQKDFIKRRITRKFFKTILEEAKVDFINRWQKPSQRQNEDNLDSFDCVFDLGKGSFGEVVLVKKKVTKKFFGLKILDKQKIVQKKQVEHTLCEKKILEAVSFPFIIGMEESFKDNSNLYLVLEAITGGDFFQYLNSVSTISECDAKFYAGQVTLALEYLHTLYIIYRDVKPENLLIDSSGYLKLTDFGLAKQMRDRTYTICGTPQYMAPEIYKGRGYNKAVDWWALGILIHEMIYGTTPFEAETEEQTVQHIINPQVSISHDGSPALNDLIWTRLLQTDITKRYGSLRNGPRDVKEHTWFNSIDWIALYQKKIKAPFIPQEKSLVDIQTSLSSVHVRKTTSQEYVQEFEDF